MDSNKLHATILNDGLTVEYFLVENFVIANTQIGFKNDNEKKSTLNLEFCLKETKNANVMIFFS